MSHTDLWCFLLLCVTKKRQYKDMSLWQYHESFVFKYLLFEVMFTLSCKCLSLTLCILGVFPQKPYRLPTVWMWINREPRPHELCILAACRHAALTLLPWHRVRKVQWIRQARWRHRIADKCRFRKE